MNAVFVVVGLAVSLFGIVSVMRPEIPIMLRNEWARLLSRPFLHGRVLGGEARKDDPLQRLVSRLGGALAIVVGIGMVLAAFLGNNG